MIYSFSFLHFIMSLGFLEMSSSFLSYEVFLNNHLQKKKKTKRKENVKLATVFELDIIILYALSSWKYVNECRLQRSRTTLLEVEVTVDKVWVKNCVYYSVTLQYNVVQISKNTLFWDLIVKMILKLSYLNPWFCVDLKLIR